MRPLWRKLALVRRDGVMYLHRRGLQTPWFNVYLHRIEAADPGRDLHNHPWWFASFILRGGYREEIEGRQRHTGAAHYLSHTRWSLHTVPLRMWHRIVAVEPDTLTLVVTGPYKREWGFRTSEGFVPADEYVHAGLLVDDNGVGSGS